MNRLIRTFDLAYGSFIGGRVVAIFLTEWCSDKIFPICTSYQVALPYPEPATHFALVCGTRSGPALRCYSPANIDKELMEAAHNFLRGGGLIIDWQAKVALMSMILKW